MYKKCFVFALLWLLLTGLSSVSATTPPAKIVSGVVSNVVSALIKWLWSLNSNTKPAVSSRSMMKFEGGYTVETVFDGSKLGIEPYSVEVSPSGEVLVLDSENNNVYEVSTPLTRYSRPKLVAGSTEGYSGHVDGKLREARLNHPKGLTMDDRGNIYIADTMNMAIRKISDGTVTTIAGGKWSRGSGHIDGPSEDAKFSDDFDVVYIGSSCSLLVVDRGNQAIREIQLNEDDCNHQYDGTLHLGVAVLIAAAFFGYMLALLQRRVQSLFSPRDDARAYVRKSVRMPQHQMPPRSVRPPVIPDEEEPEKLDEGFFGSIGRLIFNTVSTTGEIFGGMLIGSRKKQIHYQYHQQYQQQPMRELKEWPMQERYVIPREEEMPWLETRAPTPKRPYQAISKEPAKTQVHQFKQRQGYYGGEYDHHQQIQQQEQQQRHYTTNPKTMYEKSRETNEIVFGAVQEHDGRRKAMVIKAVDYSDPRYNHQNIRPRFNYVGYS